MVKKVVVRVNKVESYSDINGVQGKIIELVEDQPTDVTGLSKNCSAEMQMIEQTMVQLQRMMPAGMVQNRSIPKIVLYLTEDEYDSLGLNLDVNHTYEVTFGEQGIKFVGGAKP